MWDFGMQAYSGGSTQGEIESPSCYVIISAASLHRLHLPGKGKDDWWGQEEVKLIEKICFYRRFYD